LEKIAERDGSSYVMYDGVVSAIGDAKVPFHEFSEDGVKFFTPFFTRFMKPDRKRVCYYGEYINIEKVECYSERH
jgi:hypothetical protein